MPPDAKRKSSELSTSLKYRLRAEQDHRGDHRVAVARDLATLDVDVDVLLEAGQHRAAVGCHSWRTSALGSMQLSVIITTSARVAL